MNAATFAAIVPHLLRPWGLLALLVLPMLWWLRRMRGNRDTPWRQAVDPHLLPSLLLAAPASKQRAAWLFGMGYALAVFALSGPSWKQLPVPLYVPSAPLVVVMDMSSHMLAADLPPSRTLRARLKVEQLIAQRKGGQLGLVAYAGDAFTVAPLSNDANSLRDLLAALAPDTMPVDGQRADRGIRRAVELLSQAGYRQGRILLFSDAADAAARAAARTALSKGYALDVIGVGTATGAPLPSNDGSFVQDSHGVMQVARLDETALRELARDGGGEYAKLQSDAGDLAALGVLDRTADATLQHGDAELRRWRDDGPFLLLALLPLAALGFRRGWLAIVVLAVFAMPVQRASAADAEWWNGLWQRADQRADHALRTGDAAAANALARTPEQRAAAAYRSGRFSAAADAWSGRDSADANYNRGNALAQMQRYPDAISAYERALRLQPGMADAKANLALVRRRQQQQEKQQPQDRQAKDHQGHDQQQRDQQQGEQQRSGDQQQGQQSQQGQQQKNQQQSGQQQHDRQGQDGQQENRQQNNGQRESQSQDQPAPDPGKQKQADAAERKALEQALKKGSQEDKTSRQGAAAKESTTQREQREAIEALLQRVPDDPGGLLRRKFALEYARRQQEGGK